MLLDLEIDRIEDNEDCPFTIDDFRQLAKSYIDLYFVDKKDKNGKPYSKEVLYSPRNVSLVLDMNINTNMESIYEGMKSKFGSVKQKGKLHPDVVFVLAELNSCSRRCIPKNFATGLIVVLLEVHYGCKIDV